jgi:hypothetical protein
MLFYIKCGNLDTCQYAACHKQAAIDFIKENEECEFGKFVLVGLEEISEDSDCGRMMFFSTDALILERDRGMRLVG